MALYPMKDKQTFQEYSDKLIKADAKRLADDLEKEFVVTKPNE